MIVAAYPQSFSLLEGASLSPLRQLERALSQLLPPGSDLHLLPFYPSDGDHGFAPNDWFNVDPAFGTMLDVRRIARGRELIVDGIYNHVGIGHPWVREVVQDLSGLDRLSASRLTNPAPRLISHRGSPVMRQTNVNGVRVYFRHTFSSRAVDINLDHDDVRAAILRHLDFLVRIGAKGVRLDAAAYYGRAYEASLAHHPDAKRLTREIANECRIRGLNVYAQLNLDSDGLSYREDGKRLWLTDFGLPALISLALLGFRPERLVHHLRSTWHTPEVLRPLRTHDGMLLRGNGWSHEYRVGSAADFEKAGLQVRYVMGSPYEVNASLPEVMSRNTSTSVGIRRIRVALAIAMLITGTPYIFFPVLYYWRPESSLSTDGDDDCNEDPRGTNRRPIDSAYATAFLRSPDGVAMKRTMAALDSLRRKLDLEHPKLDDYIAYDRGILFIRRGAVLLAALNLTNREASAQIPISTGCAPLTLSAHEWRVWSTMGLVVSDT